MSALPLPGWLTFQALAAVAFCFDVVRRMATDRGRALLRAGLSVTAGAFVALLVGALLERAPTPVSWGALLGTGASWCALSARSSAWLPSADFIAPSLALLPGIGRLGCLVVGCDGGRANAWGLAWLPRYPTQALEAALGLSLWVVGSTLPTSRAGLRCGVVALVYGAGRVVIDGLRDPSSTLLPGPFSFGQWMGLSFVLAGAFLLLRPQRKSP